MSNQQQETINKYIELTKLLVEMMSEDMDIEFDHVTLLDYLALAGIVISDHSEDGINYASLAFIQEIKKALTLSK
jgi:hypothetical protein